MLLAVGDLVKLIKFVSYFFASSSSNATAPGFCLMARRLERSSLEGSVTSYILVLFYFLVVQKGLPYFICVCSPQRHPQRGALGKYCSGCLPGFIWFRRICLHNFAHGFLIDWWRIPHANFVSTNEKCTKFNGQLPFMSVSYFDPCFIHL